MAPDNLEQQLKAAALAKVRAETEKLAAETQALQHPAPTGRFGNFKEVLTLLAGVLGTVGGSWAVWTGIEVATLKKEMLTYETQQVQSHLDSLTTRNQQLQRLTHLGDSTLQSAKTQADLLSRRTPALRRTLDSTRALVRAFGLPASQVTALDQQLRAIARTLAEAEQNAGYLSTDLQAAATQQQAAPNPAAPPASQPPPDPGAVRQQVQGLFAASPGARGRAYQQIMTTYAAAPGLLAQLLAQTRQELARPGPNGAKNLNGIYNTLVVLSHLEPLPANSDPATLRQFAAEVRAQNLGPRINDRVSKLEARLTEKK